MPRKARDERLDTRAVRLRLKVRAEPYFRPLQEGRAIGYRRLGGGRAGTWIARAHDPVQGRRYRALGSADDTLDADGGATLTFAQAQERARAWFPRAFAEASEAEAPKVPATVRAAIDHYLSDYRSRGGKAEASARAAIDAHILPALGDVRLDALTATRLKAWHASLAKAAARQRRKGNALPTVTAESAHSDPDQDRARRATANRVLTILKAVLNLAFREGLVASDDTWRRVRPFQHVETPRIRFLDDAEARRLVNTCPTDFRRIVTAALLTGCRYGELVALRASDIDVAAGTLHIPVSKGGTGRHVYLTAEGLAFFAALVAGRAREATVLVREDGDAWGKSHQHRPLRDACARARIAPAISFHVLRHTYASRLARAGTPMLAIAAQLGHADTRMTSKHYAHLAPDHVAQAVRAGFSELLAGGGEISGAVPMRAAQQGPR